MRESLQSLKEAQEGLSTRIEFNTFTKLQKKPEASDSEIDILSQRVDAQENAVKVLHNSCNANIEQLYKNIEALTGKKIAPVQRVGTQNNTDIEKKILRLEEDLASIKENEFVPFTVHIEFQEEMTQMMDTLSKRMESPTNYEKVTTMLAGF